MSEDPETSGPAELRGTSVPHRRIELSGDTEGLRLRHDPARGPVPPAPQREENLP